MFKRRAGPDSFRVPGGIRTPNLLIRSQLLYPVELQTRCEPTSAPRRDEAPATGHNGRLRFVHQERSAVYSASELAWARLFVT